MASPDLDVAIIGAGPAGVAAALGLLAEGWCVALIDPGQPPTPRIESLPANGQALALGLGLGPALAAAGRGRASAMRLYWRAQPETRTFGTDAPLLLDRAELHHALRRLIPPESLRGSRARNLCQDGETVHLDMGGTPVTARFVIDARGRAGQRRTHDAAQSEFALAFTARIDDAARADCAMLLHALPEGWLWACTLPDGTLSGSVFVPAADLAGCDADARASRLAKHLGDADLPLRAQAGAVVPAMLQMVTDPFATPRILRIGDAALARNPIASHGLVHALRSGAQAAAAVATLLAPEGDDAAARAFVRTSHRDATAAALDATARSFADQSLHRTPFWSRAATEPLPAAPAPAPLPDLSQPLALLPLRRVPMLGGGRIHWTDAIWLPRSARSAARFGPVGAAQLADILTPPARISVLTARLDAAFGPRTARTILQELLREGALTAPARNGSQAATVRG